MLEIMVLSFRHETLNRTLVMLVETETLAEELEVLVAIPHVAPKTKHTSLAAQYQRIAARRGKKRALIAVGQTILTIVYSSN
jgi:hypothetical protein